MSADNHASTPKDWAAAYYFDAAEKLILAHVIIRGLASEIAPTEVHRPHIANCDCEVALCYQLCLQKKRLLELNSPVDSKIDPVQKEQE